MEVDTTHQPPRATSKLHPRTDDSYYPLPVHKPRSGGRGSGIGISICDKLPVYLFAFFVSLCAVLLVFSLIVLRPNSPTLRIADVSAKHLAYDLGNSTFLNATVIAGVTLTNTNFGRFVFEGNGSVVGLAFDGDVLGEREIGGGSVAARRMRRIEVEVEVAYRVSSPPAAGNLSRGIDVGLLELRGYGRIGGKVHLLKYVKRSLSSVLNCTLSLNLQTRNFQDLRCE
ncbi:hypothetical protein MLD38_013924 [Melastoma candidum]|uniref:Uncharacterized protein n=1 Tax=Melastoma candidum TaxID=119954 RepID=A0ACB9RCB1_9MYRT|nr:hypothetical protein MLD38_013924 [Melastoma candidum]